MRNRVSGAFSDDIAIDLGTANTLVHVAGRGIIIDEPSVVAVRAKDVPRHVIAVGEAAVTLKARSPEPIELIRPLRDGVIADFVATEEMLRTFIKRAKTKYGFRRPRILICVPAAATPVERRAVHETAKAVGARRVYLVEEPVAAAIGAGIEIDDASAMMILDIGGGTSDIAVLSGARSCTRRRSRSRATRSTKRSGVTCAVPINSASVSPAPSGSRSRRAPPVRARTAALPRRTSAAVTWCSAG